MPEPTNQLSREDLPLEDGLETPSTSAPTEKSKTIVKTVTEKFSDEGQKVVEAAKQKVFGHPEEKSNEKEESQDEQKHPDTIDTQEDVARYLKAEVSQGDPENKNFRLEALFSRLMALKAEEVSENETIQDMLKRSTSKERIIGYLVEEIKKRSPNYDGKNLLENIPGSVETRNESSGASHE